LRLESLITIEGLVVIGLGEGPATPILLTSRHVPFSAGETIELTCEFERLPLPRGRYFVWVGVFRNNRDLLPWRPAAHADVVGSRLDRSPPAIVRLAPVAAKTTWSTD